MRPISPRPPRRWRRILLILAGVVLAPLGWVVLGQCIQRWTTGKALQQAVAEVDAIDPGWRYEDIESQRRPVPDEENGARQVMTVVRLLPSAAPRPGARPEVRQVLLDGRLAVDAFKELPPQEQLNAAQANQLREELQDLGPAVAEARLLAERPYGRHPVVYNVDYLSTIVDDIQQCRTVANLLVFDAVFRAQEGDADGACISVGAAISSGRSVGDEPTPIALLVRVGCVHLAVEALERTLAQGQPGEASLANLLGLLALEEEEAPIALLASVRGERALAHRMMNALEAGDLTLSQALEGSRKPPSLWDRAHAIIEVPVIRYGHVVYLRQMTERVEVARLPAVEQEALLQELGPVPKDPKAPLAYPFVNAIDKIIRIGPRNQAVLRCARAAVACELYRREQHRWPDALDALVPAYLPAVPTDPYDGKPLRYARLDDGILIYSLGPDGTDDGGKIARANPTAPGTNIGFRLWDVAQRRQPPTPKPAGPDPEGQ